MEIRIKLKMFGDPLDGPEILFCGNNRVVNNMNIPESTLFKKHNAVNYHCVSDVSACGIMRVSKEDTATNLANSLTKLLPYSCNQ